MIKKIILLLLISVLASCASTKYKGQSYSGDKEFYPAVLKVIKDYDATVEELDVFRNEYLSSYIYDTDIIIPIRYKILVNIRGGKINTQLVYVEQQFNDPEHNLIYWRKHQKLISFDINKTRNTISKKIIDVLRSPTLYKLSKKELLNNLAFHHMVIKDLTSIATQNWVKSNMLGRTYNLDMNLEGLRENKTNEFKNLKYIGNFSYNRKHSFQTEFSINLYTNNERYVRMKLLSPVKIRGKIIESSKLSFSNNSYAITLTEVSE